MPLTPPGSGAPPGQRAVSGAGGDGQVLIPAEMLPAAAGVPVTRPPRPPAPPPDPSRQLSLFGVESVDASPADLAGLLLGAGQLHRMGGTARVSVPVDAAWRVHVLLAELAARGLEASWRRIDTAPPPTHPAEAEATPATTDDAGEGAADMDPGEYAADDPDPGGFDAEGMDLGEFDADGTHLDADGTHVVGRDGDGVHPGGDDADGTNPGEDEPDGTEAGEQGVVGSFGAGVMLFEVRTAYSSLLAGLARTWLDGTAKRAPERFVLTGPRLRLWVVAGGAPRPAGYELRLGAGDPPQVCAAAGMALAQAGLPAELVGGPGYRIAGRRRLARLAELVGERPSAAPPGVWPEI